MPISFGQKLIVVFQAVVTAIEKVLAIELHQRKERYEERAKCCHLVLDLLLRNNPTSINTVPTMK